MGVTGGECVTQDRRGNDRKVHRDHAEKGVDLLKKTGLHPEDSESHGWVLTKEMRGEMCASERSSHSVEKGAKRAVWRLVWKLQ